MSINKVIVSGNLTRDAELDETPGGTGVLRFGVAVNDRRQNRQTGEWEDYANFVDCAMFGKRAEALSGYLLKGTKVCIEGRLHYSSWEDRNGGGKRSKLDVTVDELEFMSRQQDGQQSAQRPQQRRAEDSPTYQAMQQAKRDADAQAAAYNDEDIPF